MKIAAVLLSAGLAVFAPGVFSKKDSIQKQPTAARIAISPAAQNQPTITGKITDAATGQPLVGATVEVFSENKTVARTTADAQGEYKIEGLAAGSYSVEFGAAGFERRRIAGLLVEKEKTIRFDVSLKSSTVLDEVVVTGPGSRETREVSHSKEMRASGSSAAMMKTDSRAMGAVPSEKRKARADRPATMAVKPAPPAPSEAPVDYMALPAPVSDEGVIVDGVKYRPEIEFSPETYEEKVRLVRDDTGEPMDKSAAKKMAYGETYDMERPATSPKPRAGLLTAGEWNDLNHWGKHWADLLADGETEPFQKKWLCQPKNRYAFLLTNKSGFPLVDATVKMFDQAGSLVWEAKTDNTGKAECWAGFFGEKLPESTVAQAIMNGKQIDLGHPVPFEKGLNRRELDFECGAPKNVDIVFAVDATGSMGDEIRYLQSELIDVLGRAQAANPGISLRTGSVFYRDVTDDYLVKASGLNSDVSKTVDYIRKQSADGGGDWPEAVHSALEEVVFHQKWSEKAVARICFLVLDASPHDEAAVKASLQQSILAAAAKGIRVVPVVASGIQKETEWLMKFLDMATNGSYVFLTDHSGIGGKHLEPTTDEYKVELLNDLLVRIITEYSTVKNCEGKSEIRFQPDGQNQQEQAVASFYPNPASTEFNVELPFEADVMTLYNADGQAVRSVKKPGAGVQSVAVGDLPEGVYTLRILKGNQWQSGKVMVIRA